MLARPLALALALLVAGCNVTLTNDSTNVTPVLSGTIDLHWTASTQGVGEVDYRVDGNLVGGSRDASSQFLVKLDTSKYANGSHDLLALPYDASGTPQGSPLENTIVVHN